jgi:hypothetical protein
MKATFDELGLSLAIDSKLSYGDDMILNINTVSEYLFELEQYITKYLVYVRTKQQEANPDCVMLDVDQIHPKEFGEREITIKEFLEQDMIVANDDENLPLTLD